MNSNNQVTHQKQRRVANHDESVGMIFVGRCSEGGVRSPGARNEEGFRDISVQADDNMKDFKAPAALSTAKLICCTLSS